MVEDGCDDPWAEEWLDFGLGSFAVTVQSIERLLNDLSELVDVSCSDQLAHKWDCLLDQLELWPWLAST